MMRLPLALGLILTACAPTPEPGVWLVGRPMPVAGNIARRFEPPLVDPIEPFPGLDCGAYARYLARLVQAATDLADCLEQQLNTVDGCLSEYDADVAAALSLYIIEWTGCNFNQ